MTHWLECCAIGAYLVPAIIVAVSIPLGLAAYAAYDVVWWVTNGFTA